MEAYSMTTNRNLPNAHPIYKLLRPHFRYTMAINAAARATLINKGGIIDKLFSIGGEGKEEVFKRVSRVYNVHWTNIEYSLKQRKVDCEVESKEEHKVYQLPSYYYRDDGLQIWSAIKDFASKIINEFYTTDDAVLKDEELQVGHKTFTRTHFPVLRMAAVFQRQSPVRRCW